MHHALCSCMSTSNDAARILHWAAKVGMAARHVSQLSFCRSLSWRTDNAGSSSYSLSHVHSPPDLCHAMFWLDEAPDEEAPKPSKSQNDNHRVDRQVDEAQPKRTRGLAADSHSARQECVSVSLPSASRCCFLLAMCLCVTFCGPFCPGRLIFFSAWRCRDAKLQGKSSDDIRHHVGPSGKHLKETQGVHARVDPAGFPRLL